MQHKLAHLESKKFKTQEDKSRIEQLKSRIEAFQENQQEIYAHFEHENFSNEMEGSNYLESDTHGGVSYSLFCRAEIMRFF